MDEGRTVDEGSVGACVLERNSRTVASMEYF